MHSMDKDFMQMLAAEHILATESIPFADCRVPYPQLLMRRMEQAGVSSPACSVLMLAVPYRTSRVRGNISAYAAARDYHLFFHMLYEKLLLHLRQKYPCNWFLAFSDHSPIAEVDAAVKSGLGVRGDMGMLLTREYGSYVFLGELISSLPPVSVSGRSEATCEHCGACRRACPSPAHCLSDLTQTKGELTEQTKQLMRTVHTAWGCDVCQEVCPWNVRAKQSEVPFFQEQCIPNLTREAVLSMSKAEFATRAFSWRGRACILRNLAVLEEAELSAQKN